MLSAQQIITQATQIAKVPGMTLQAGQILNGVLQELCMTYDFDVNLTLAVVNLTPTIGVGPYPLPTDYLRAASRDLVYMISGIPYRLIQITKAEFDILINTMGIANYPTNYATDTSPQSAGGNPLLYVYPPPVTNIPLNVRYYTLQADIATPEASPSVPWFVFQPYLIRRVAGELMNLAGDPRADKFLGDGPAGCIGMLRRYLNLEGDDEDTVKQVQLDARYFGLGGAAFPPSKVTGGV